MVEAETLTKIIAVGSVVGATLLFIVWIGTTWNRGPWIKLVFDHFRAIIGLPAAAAAAFAIVSLFRTTEGQIKFSGLGLTFEGASGPIVLWIICFLAIAAAIRALW